MRRQLPQLFVDERQELLGSLRIALLDGGENAGDVGHGTECRVRSPDPQWCSTTGMDVLPAAPVSLKYASYLRCKNPREYFVGQMPSSFDKPGVGLLQP